MAKIPSFIPVPPFDETPGCCGPASLKMILAYYGVEKTERELTRLCHCTPAHGTRAEAILRVAKELGFRGTIKDNSSLKDIRRYVRKNVPVIIDWFSQTDGHYSVVVGIDEENIYLQDPHLGHMRAIELPVFKRIWFDFPGPYLRSRNDLILRRLIIITPKEHIHR